LENLISHNKGIENSNIKFFKIFFEIFFEIFGNFLLDAGGWYNYLMPPLAVMAWGHTPGLQ
jgi:hypothetical protein